MISWLDNKYGKEISISKICLTKMDFKGLYHDGYQSGFGNKFASKNWKLKFDMKFDKRVWIGNMNLKDL